MGDKTAPKGKTAPESTLERFFESRGPVNGQRRFKEAIHWRVRLFGAMQSHAHYPVQFFDKDLEEEEWRHEPIARHAAIRFDQVLAERSAQLQDLEQQHALSRALTDVYIKVEMFITHLAQLYGGDLPNRTFLRKFKALQEMLEVFHRPTAEHCERTGNYVKEIAQFLAITSGTHQFSHSRLAELILLANIHDIGKIAVRETTLNGTTSLSSEQEWEIREHSVAAFEILRRLKFPAWAMRVLLHYHKHFDGSGYPKGAGLPQEKPLEADVLLAADTLEVMRHGRPYQPAMSNDQIIEEFRSQRGKQFSPKVADAVIAYLQSQSTSALPPSVGSSQTPPASPSDSA